MARSRSQRLHTLTCFAVATAQARVGTIRTCLCGSVTQFALLGGLDTLVDRVHRAVQHHTNAYVIVGRPQ